MVRLDRRKARKTSKELRKWMDKAPEDHNDHYDCGTTKRAMVHVTDESAKLTLVGKVEVAKDTLTSL